MEEQSSFDSVPMEPTDMSGYDPNAAAQPMDTSANDMNAAAAAPYVFKEPKLHVTTVYVLPEAPNSTHSLQLGVEVENIGEFPTSEFRVKFSLDNGDTEIQDWPILEVGRKHWREWEHGPLPAGNHVLHIQLDPDNILFDTDKSTHVAQHAFVVAEGHFASVGRRSDAEAVVGRITTNMLFFVNNYWNNYRDALGEFTRQMQFPADAEADVDSASGLIAGATSLFNSSLDMALAPLATTPLAPILPLVGALKSAVEGWAAAEMAAMQARQKIIVRDYISGLMERIETGNEKMQSAVMNHQIELQNELDKRIESSGSDTKTGEYKGEAAEMVDSLEKAAQDLKSSTPNTGQFLQQFTVRFVQSQDEDKYTHGASGKQLGTLRITVKLKSTDSGTWEIDDLDDKWTLLTSAPEKAKLAGVLKRRLSSGNVQEVWQLGLECMVQMHLDDDYALITVGNGPLDVIVSNATKDGRVAERVWKTPAIYNRVFGVHDIDG
jgi:hypothetical protein